MDRIEKIIAEIPYCDSFADIGCDHGYVTLGMLKSNKCKSAIISDISEKCLSKAQLLLIDYIKKGIVKSVVSNGFQKIEKVDCALLAGMGGEEIVSILHLANTLPNTLVLQPMKNCDKVRQVAVDLGYRFIKDFVFKSGKCYYNLMILERGKDKLSQEEIEFGRSNLLGDNSDFKQMIKEEIDKLMEYSKVENISETSKQNIISRVEKLKKYV